MSDSWRKIGGASYSEKCDKDIIDSSGSTWYRFVGNAGKRLPESANPQNMKSKSVCGTHGAAWIQPAHPTLADGVVSRLACFAWSNNNCYYNVAYDHAAVMIHVLACRESNGDVYHIYKLKPPKDCNFAYCAEGM